VVSNGAFVLAAVAVVLSVGVYYALEWNRAKRIRELAPQLDCSYTRQAGRELLNRFAGFALFDEGRGRNEMARNLLQGRIDSTDVAVFDYHGTLERHKQRGDIHTACVLTDDRLQLPAFRIMPATLGDKFRAGCGLRGDTISLAERPSLDGRYVLRGHNETEIRAIFTREVAEFFEFHDGYTVEGWGASIVVYTHRKRVTPQQIETLLHDALELLPCLAAATAAAQREPVEV